MKRLTILVVGVTVTLSSMGCSCGLFRSRGARCGVPSFRLPRLRSPIAPARPAPCANGQCGGGCPTGNCGSAVPMGPIGPVGPGVPIGSPQPFIESQQPYSVQPYTVAPPIEGSYSSTPSFVTTPIDGVPTESTIDSGVQQSYRPVYAGPAVVTNEPVAGPEVGVMPTAP